MPPDLLKMIPSPERWDQQKSVEWASKLKVSTQSLGYALKDAGLISEKQVDEIIKAKVPAEMKSDPEFPMTLSPRMRQRREEFLIRGLSMFYVGLCFDAYDRGEISAGRLGEMLLTKEDELPALAEIYGRQIKHEN